MQIIPQRSQSHVPPSMRDEIPPTPGQMAAEWVASMVGSWRFIIVQSAIITIWIILNLTGAFHRWDAYPFILLNLMLSLQAAYTAPMILMSQNRQAEKDRRILYGGYDLDHSTTKDLQETLAVLQRLEKKVVELESKVDRIEAGLNG